VPILDLQDFLPEVQERTVVGEPLPAILETAAEGFGIQIIGHGFSGNKGM
jgi:hypothetical protein